MTSRPPSKPQLPTTLFGLRKRVWYNSKLTKQTKVQVNEAWILITLLYGSESWTLHSKQKRGLNSFHMHCLGHILGISWRDKVPNKTLPEMAGITSMCTLQRHLYWLGHVSLMEDNRISKDLLFGGLATGKRLNGRPQLCFMDICKRDLKALAINTDNCMWQMCLETGGAKGSLFPRRHLDARGREKESPQKVWAPSTGQAWHSAAQICGRDCHSHKGLCRHHSWLIHHQRHSIVTLDWRMPQQYFLSLCVSLWVSLSYKLSLTMH